MLMRKGEVRFCEMEIIRLIIMKILFEKVE